MKPADFLNLIRIKHWIKNIIIFIPLVFALKFKFFEDVLFSVQAVLMFCLICSAVYIINGIFDIENDRRHPFKKNRPLASGKISVNTAAVITLFLLISAFYLAAALNTYCVIIIAVYLLTNILYTKFFKNIVIFDIFVITFGFILRILAGCAAISVVPSHFIILLTFFASLFFGFSKRKLELNLAVSGTRENLKLYTNEILNQLILLSAALSVAFYSMYTIDFAVATNLNTGNLYITVIPFSYIVIRLLYIINSPVSSDDPAELIYDKQILIASLIYIVTVAFLLV